MTQVDIESTIIQPITVQFLQKVTQFYSQVLVVLGILDILSLLNAFCVKLANELYPTGSASLG